MKILIDTRIFLWAIKGDLRLSGSRQEIFLDESNQLYLSIASIELFPLQEFEVILRTENIAPGKLAGLLDIGIPNIANTNDLGISHLHRRLHQMLCPAPGFDNANLYAVIGGIAAAANSDRRVIIWLS